MLIEKQPVLEVHNTIRESHIRAVPKLWLLKILTGFLCLEKILGGIQMKMIVDCPTWNSVSMTC